MKPVKLLVSFLFIVGLSVSYAQEDINPDKIINDESNQILQPPKGPPCEIPLNTVTTNCNLIVYCYDLTGNRTHRFAPNCNINPWGGTSSNLGMIAPPNSNLVVVYDMDILFPNPTSGKAILEFSKEIFEGELKIISSRGEILQKLPINGKSIEFDLTQYSEGTYFIAVFSKDKNFVKPIIKSNKYENIK